MKQRITETDRADLIKRIANLPPANRALLEQKLKVQGFDSFIKQIISRRATRESAPLSYSQRRLWFLDQYEPNSSVYNVPSGLRLKGALDVAALERSLNEIVHRHEALRTTFSMIGGEPVQAIAPSLTVALSMEDLSGCAEEEREEKARQLVREEAHRPFDLSQGPLFRSKLVRFGDEDHILLLTMHHIVSDGWSMGVLQRELSVLYRAFMNGHPSPLVDLPIQYGDFAKWQGEWLQGEVLERQLSYWKGQLEGSPAVLNLPTDHPRPAAQSFRGRTQSIELSKGLTEGLKGLSRKEGVTLFMVLLAAFQTLLYRYTGQGDVVVGSPIANRNRSEIEGLIGFFVNTLVLRSDLSGNPSFRELLGRVRKMALEAYEHQDLPFEKLVEELQPERSLSYSPLFQVMFVLQNAPSTELELEGLGVNRLRVGGETAKFDLTLSMHETAAGLSGSLQYNTDLFDDATITRMLGHLQRLLEGVVAKPDEGIGYLPILSEAEERQLLIEWNDTKTDYPRDKCIHGLFETQVEKTPDAIALVFEDQQLTYSELNTRANQLARYLQKLGVGPEVLVGICVERSIEMVVGLLGILKAGGGYLPLDVNYPAERLEFMLADAQVSVLLTQSDQFEDEESRLDDSDGRSSSLNRRIQRICLDRDWEFITTESDANPGNTPTADNLAYVIYTSGSTGRPKGVAIEHRNTVGFLSWVHSTFTPEELSAVFAATSICFDLSVFEIFAPLTCGGTIILAQNALALAIPNRTKVSLLNTVPSAMNELLNLVAIPQSVRVINLAGEPLRTDLVRRIYESTSVRKVHDLYGPTECTTYSTWTCRTPDGPQTIGRPIVNTQVYILDDSLNPVPVGVAGELHIGGDGLARGYLNRPELTAEKFIHNPFSADPTSRLYKTGDLSRYLPDGNIEFLGRIDHQVKIRGYRIELGEIESVLRQHRSVPEAVVLAREESPGDKQLVAYVVFNRDEVCTVRELRSFLRGKLPDYMVPSAFVALDSLPLTPNGKVDRKALLAPDQIRPELQESFVAPRTPIEEIIADVWAEVLKLGKVGIHDNFFDLGGHSLLATQIISRVRDAFQMDIPLRTLFEKPTVAGLAERFEEIHQKKQGLQILPLLPVSRDKDLPLSFAQQRLWFLDQLEPGSTVYNVPGTVRIRGQLNVAALDQSLNEIVTRHEVLRTTFSTVGGQPVQIIASSLSLSLPVVDLGAQAETEREEDGQRLALEEARRPFDLARGPLVRATLLRLAHEDHVLLLSLHHIVCDGWSMGVFYRELSVLYQAFSNGRPSPLVALPIQYADFGVWQRQWLAGEVLETQLSYWREQLTDVALLQLPTDRQRPAVQSYRGARQSIELSKELTQALKALSRSHDVTLYMTLLAAFQTLLHRYTGQDDIAVGSPIANRNRHEIESLIGFFVNTLVMRSDLSGNPPFRQLLARVREVALGAYAHQDLPFEKLVEELQPERSLSYSPLFQVMFVLQNAPSRDLEVLGLSLDFMPIESRTAKFDLLLSMSENACGLKASLEYSIDLFDAVTIRRILSHFQTLLEGIVANPEQRISELPLLAEAEKHQMLVEWNDTKTDYPRDKCIHELFETQVEKTPDAIALVFEDQQLTYRELNTRANQLAYYLQKLGVGPDMLVGLCVERSVEIVVGLLGILKAGAAYVPLDPGYPRERLAFILADTQAPVLITTQRLLEGLPNHAGRIVCLDAEWDRMAHQAQQECVSKVTPTNLAYAIYTSGSSGQPKAVAMSHRSLCNLLSWQLQTSTHSTPVRTLQFASLSFDVSFQEIFATFYSGGTLVLVSEELRRDAVGWLHYLRDHSVERLFLPFIALQQLAETAVHERTVPESLREIITAGEQLHITEPIISLFNKLKDCTLHNQYGPSESHVVTAFTLTGPSDTWPSLPPIGRPISNTQIFLLDRYLNPAPVGVAAELCIGGESLARDYLNRPELTAEKFIPNPFSSEPGARLYKTGDLARYLPDGNIEFLGRIDHQVKIRGYRIELGEIEAVLAQDPAVREAVVLTREDSPGERRLVAYVIAAHGFAPSANELRSFLQQKVPEYMVPSVFMFVDSLPLTPNGKLDRKALPAPDQTRPELDEPYTAPRTPVEDLLAQIWAEVLKIEKVGIHDNFFDLGGHSLLATQVISRVSNSFQIDIQLRRLFETPTIAGLASSVEASLGIEKDSQRIPPIVPIPRSDEIPLSFAQQRLWFLDRIEPGNATYNVPAAFRLAGELKVHALEQSLTEIVRRHEVLRTIFSTVNGDPVQMISRRSHCSLAYTDLSDRPESEREQALPSMLSEEAERPFDLSRGPLIRAQLLRLASRDHVLFLNMHHIISDGWSVGVLFRELSVLYKAFCSGKPNSFRDLPIQYADYAVWQKQWLRGEELEHQLSYWRKQLDGLSTLPLPTDRARPAVQTYRGATQALDLSAQLSEAIKALSQRQGVTLFMTLLAAFELLLSRYCGQSDIAVGCPIAGRTRQETEGLIGFFVNTLVLRADLSNNPTFNELLRKVRETALEAYSHQDLPFEKLVEELHPDRHLSNSPLFQVMFVFQNTADRPLEFEQLLVNPIRTTSHSAKFDLTMSVSETNGTLRGSLNYNTDLFDGSTIERMLVNYKTLLEGILADPEQCISELPLVSEAEKHQLLVDWNDTETDYPKERCIHELFETQVEKTPDTIALVFEDQQLTYSELNTRANQLAHYLHKLGVGPEVLVGICVERSIEMVVGLLGILKAGGAYVPLDPTYPKERLRFMLQDSGAPVLIAQQAFVDVFTHHTAKIISLDADWETVGQESASNLAVETSSESLAYVIYTSGSTGEPKGVAVSHRAVNRLVMNTDYVQISPREVIAQASNASFDAATFEIWGALLNGARMVLIAKGTLLSPQCLAAAIERHGITTLFLTTALFNQMVEQIPAALGKLRYLLFGGEAVDPERVKELLRKGPPSRLLHVYGPTEATTFATCYWVKAVAADATTVPIGRPIANTGIYILDANLNPVPIGVSGELYIGGPGLARGYLNRPELTAEKFIKHPFTADPTSRLYKTGDRARYLPDSNIEFLGRLDNQVKIRGYRIEVGEIEAALSQHSAVKDSVVVMRNGVSGDKRLVAYVVPRQQDRPASSELRSYLKAKLPSYMVPSAFVKLEGFLLTTNGKLDYDSLPPPRSQDEHEEVGHVAPRDHTERLLCEIWSQVLGVNRIGIDDDFFAIGGHSLLAAKLFARLDEAFGRSLPLGVLFTASTIRSLAERYRSTVEPTGRSVIVPLRTGGSLPPIFAVPGVFGNVIGLADLARELGSEQPFYGLQSLGLDGGEAPLDSIEEIAALYVAEIRSVQARGPYAIVGACFGATVAYEMARQLLAAGEEMGFLGLLDPTPRGGKTESKNPESTPRIFRRMAAFGSLAADRLQLYREDMRRLGVIDRVKYLASKLHLLSGLIGNSNAFKGAQRELNQIEVYRANLLALDRYRREPLDGPLKAFEIFETGRPGRVKVRDGIDWQAFWDGPIQQHQVPGKDSGDMLSGENARILGALLAQQLYLALCASQQQDCPDRESAENCQEETVS